MFGWVSGWELGWTRRPAKALSGGPIRCLLFAGRRPGPASLPTCLPNLAPHLLSFAVLLVVQRAVLQDPSRSQWVMPKQARSLFRLSQRDLERLGVGFRLK